MNRAPLILVVGMHRSGTSLLGSILEALGVALPGPLIPADTHNPAGYFERSDIRALQEELLIDLQRWWPSEQGTLALPQDWLTTPRAQRAAICLKRLLTVDLQQQRGPWAIKDPRSSLLLPLWRLVAAELNLPLRLLLAFRHPAEVVTSLVNRDAAATEMTSARAQALWIRHQQQLLVDAGDLPLHVVSYSRWFDEPKTQIQALQTFCRPDNNDPTAVQTALGCICSDYRRSQTHGQAPRLKRQVRRWHRQLEQAAAGSVGALRHWARRQPGPSAHLNPRNLSTPNQHPWSRALKALGSDQSELQAAGIQAWTQSGIAPISLAQLRCLNHPGFPGDDPSADQGGPLPQRLKLGLIGGSLEDWTTHLWIHHLPLSPGSNPEICSAEATSDAALHLQRLEVTAQDPKLLLHLTQVERVFDPDPDQVKLLRLLGVNAEQLSIHHTLHNAAKEGWLNSNNVDASTQLGLPCPEALVMLGGEWLCLGSSETDDSWQRLPAALLHLPVFPPAPALSRAQARLLAAWIQACCSAGLNLVRIDPQSSEPLLWQSLGVLCFQNPINPEELLEELAWHKAGKPAPGTIHTPSPTAQVLWQHASDLPPEVSICISSYNYAKRISAALESCLAQSLPAVELLIVDDASTDDSLTRCHEWLDAHGHRFCSGKLLKHHKNSGLAAARNTAFAAASAPWCLVLDADNQIDARACELCLGLAKASPDKTAVVHPLIRICNDDGQPLGLVGGGHPWQREQLRAGNVIDAMALVRRSAWEAVGGYSHIPGGWEDFDFWCKLIEAGWHGVLYPRPLGTYTQHGASMLQSQTNQRQRQLSRLLQHRHPWLQLAFAAENR
ncbi:glycosyltransferase [Synechococcus sp. MIT S9504]|uniref:glycosyltransferase n=1 Tax=Synechococcus sp. MIT S9504 TaxID=1801628 RepID=UPI0007BBED24|nr:glycosyltransferase [Synechococcus sp. MIT S9504]KZR84311.1 Chondroitin synthase [Synechococcus sp. MIT S9504]